MPVAEYWKSTEKRAKPGTLYHTMGLLACEAAQLGEPDGSDGSKGEGGGVGGGGAAAQGMLLRELALGFRSGTNTCYVPAASASRVDELAATATATTATATATATAETSAK
jgi:hypothetical protein